MRRSDSRGEAGAGAGASSDVALIGAPQSAQKRPTAGAPQAGQAADRAMPQEGQNLAFAGIASPHAGHVGTRNTSLVESDCTANGRRPDTDSINTSEIPNLSAPIYRRRFSRDNFCERSTN
jgi:hypothetical protein